MKVAEIREAIDHLNWSRSDLQGATRDEFIRMNVPARLNPLIDSCESLEIKPRFKRDAHNRDYAVARAKAVISRWGRLNSDN